MRNGKNGSLERVITVKRAALLTKLAENKKEHEKLYNEAVVGYRVAVKNKLSAELDRVSSSKDWLENLGISMVKPTSYLKEFDRAIAMFTMEVNDEVELSEEDFSQYVMNEWDWMRNWVVSNAGYSGQTFAKSLDYR